MFIYIALYYRIIKKKSIRPEAAFYWFFCWLADRKMFLFYVIIILSKIIICGAGNGNRTRILSLEG